MGEKGNHMSTRRYWVFGTVLCWVLFALATNQSSRSPSGQKCLLFNVFIDCDAVNLYPSTNDQSLIVMAANVGNGQLCLHTRACEDPCPLQMRQQTKLLHHSHRSFSPTDALHDSRSISVDVSQAIWERSTVAGESETINVKITTSRKLLAYVY